MLNIGFVVLQIDGELNEDIKDIQRLTGTTITHIREFNAKFCRLKLLRNGLEDGLLIGDFKHLENGFFRKLMEPGVDQNNMSSDFNKLKTDAVNKEIENLVRDLENMERNIGNLRKEVKSKAENEFYEKWTMFVNGLNFKFKDIYSAENDDRFKLNMSEKNINAKKNKELVNIFHRIHAFANNVFKPYAAAVLQKQIIDVTIGFKQEELKAIFNDNEDSLINDIIGRQDKNKNGNSIVSTDANTNSRILIDDRYNNFIPKISKENVPVHNQKCIPIVPLGPIKSKSSNIMNLAKKMKYETTFNPEIMKSNKKSKIVDWVTKRSINDKDLHLTVDQSNVKAEVIKRSINDTNLNLNVDRNNVQVIDEVGEVELNDFKDLMEKHLK